MERIRAPHQVCPRHNKFVKRTEINGEILVTGKQPTEGSSTCTQMLKDISHCIPKQALIATGNFVGTVQDPKPCQVPIS
jgi:hypothetical protein